jgi:ribonuclease HII
MSSAEPAVRYRVGVDENGLGPRLGPMVVTAVLARGTDDAGWRLASRAPRGALAERLGDSKQLVSHGDVALGEAWARALVARGCGQGGAPTAASSVDAVLHAVCLDDRRTLRELCPGHVEEQCWSTEGESFVASDPMLRDVGKDLDRLADKGLEIVAVRSVLLCAKRMNDGLRAGKNRFVLDLHAMERLILELRRLAGEEVLAICGKVGGFGKYGPAFGPLAGRLHTVVEEGRPRSAYRFPGLGEIAFVRDSDASDLCVAMASMVGKYVREAMMDRIARHYRRAVDGLPAASGYYDPVTTSFIAATRLVRGAREVPDDCFERRTEGGEPARGARGGS